MSGFVHQELSCLVLSALISSWLSVPGDTSKAYWYVSVGFPVLGAHNTFCKTVIWSICFGVDWFIAFADLLHMLIASACAELEKNIAPVKNTAIVLTIQ